MPLIDLHVDWPLQYVNESTGFDPTLYPGVADRVGQVAGYLQTTRAAIISCFRGDDDWARQPDPWAALGNLIARIEAEFSGRLLIGPDDFARWLDDPGGLTWGVIGVEGFDALVRVPDDLKRLTRLFERGVRLFQPTYGPSSLLGGSAFPGDDRGLTDLGRDFLDTLIAASADGPGPRPMLDFAHSNPATASDVLAWFEAEPTRPDRLIPVYSHGAIVRYDYAPARAITRENLARLRALGGVIGLGVSPPFITSADQIQAAVNVATALPFAGRVGVEGIALGTDFLGVERTLPGLGNAAEVVAWVEKTFEPATASALLMGSARALLGRAVGSSRPA